MSKHNVNLAYWQRQPLHWTLASLQPRTSRMVKG